MTHEEAIKIIYNMIHDDIVVYGHEDKPINQALNLAIKALEKDWKVDFITKHWNDEKNNFVAACNAFEDILKLYGRGVSDD